MLGSTARPGLRTCGGPRRVRCKKLILCNVKVILLDLFTWWNVLFWVLYEESTDQIISKLIKWRKNKVSLSERLPVNKRHMDYGVLRTKCRAKKSLFIESEDDGMYSHTTTVYHQTIAELEISLSRSTATSKILRLNGSKCSLKSSSSSEFLV